MVSLSTQNYSSLKNSNWPHLLLVGQLGQILSNMVKLVKNLYYLVWVITMGDRGPAHEVGTFSCRADDLRLGEILPVIHSRDSPVTWSTSIHGFG